jgi:hypothetical protein
MSVLARIVSADESSTFELRDLAAGLVVESIQPPEENMRETVVVQDGVDGSYPTSEADDAGILVVFCRVQGDSWAQVTTRWQAARTAYRAEREFYVETVVHGVTTRYRARRPNVTGGPLTGEAIAECVQTYQLRFPVQPNPTISIA